MTNEDPMARASQLSRAAQQPEPFADVLEAAVIFEFEPRSIPLQQFDRLKLVSKLRADYGLRLDASKLGRQADKVRAEFPPNEADALLLTELLDVGDRARFENGMFRFRAGAVDTPVPVKALTIVDERIEAFVQGPSRAGEELIARAAEALWECCAAQRPWDRLEQSVSGKRFVTQTYTDLGFPPTRLLSKSVLEFFDAEGPKGARFFSDMGTLRQAAQAPITPRTHFTTAVFFSRVELTVVIRDPGSELVEECILHWSHHRRSDRASTFAVLSTELPYDRHLDLIRRLRDRMGTAGA